MAAAKRFAITPALWDRVNHFSLYNQTGVSLRQMVEHGRKHSPLTILQAGHFLREELPIRLAHRVKELDELPNGLSDMPSIIRVKEWYAQSFEELVNFPKANLPEDIKQQLASSVSHNPMNLSSSTPNPSLSSLAATHEEGQYEEQSAEAAQRSSNERMRARAKQLEESSSGSNGNGSLRKRVPLEHRHYADHAQIKQIPPEVIEYNEQFTRMLEQIKKRHDAVVTTVAQGVLEYKRAKKGKNIQADVQRFLDRFYMSRIGIRILIGQHIALARQPSEEGASKRAPVRAAFGSLGEEEEGAQDEEAEKYVGIICTNTNVGAMAREAIENARFVCEEHYGLFKGPPVQLICPKNLTFM
jgi:pyruvate dehydrogenase kinase 2/3/4